MKNVDGFCIPKVNNKEDVQEIEDAITKLEERLGAGRFLKVIVQIETTEALNKMDEIFIAGKGRVIAGAFGADDFLTDFGIQRKHNIEELDFYRRTFALKCAAHKMVSIDTPYVKHKDPEGLKNELEYIKGIGMNAKFAIHPLQIDIIDQAFKPNEDQIIFAVEFVKVFEKAMAEGKAAIVYENKMCDVPVYKRMVEVLKQVGLR
eukprot:CAMPEP_0205805246 /NCGR_PEP_ID=MMETSP0205-20121125/8414_1 /ASSEMBLY_ACC=CAM_ASM_000278 /TAXON_ID=36767 /ORGANISM="Euplotes focardii, Strain TN1" /LENGTH=204 /DNA_ID=CAMNT_0053076161 /DNA_START=390 /DNA_END=1004 /DNA_ORIENTATION=-